MPDNCVELFECIDPNNKNPLDFRAKAKTDTQPSKLAIVRYHPNGYFGLLDEYLANGWIDEGDVIKYKNISIAKTIFALQEGYYVLAFVSLYPNEEQPQLEPIEDRLLYINQDEQTDFFKAYEYANKTLILNS